jgi:hypothetical protein
MIRLARLCTPTIVVGLVMVFAAGAASAQSSDSLDGTWKMDPAKSTYSPGPKPQSITLVWEGTDAARKITVDQTPSTGEARHWSVSGAFGKELPVVGNNPNADVYVIKRVNATTVEVQYLKDGKPTIKQTLVVAADGKTLTVTASGNNAQGQTVHNVVVYGK